MKWNLKSFGIKLWMCFVIFAAVIFAALWLLQTVFLQSFYNMMAIHNVKRTAMQIETQIKKEAEQIFAGNAGEKEGVAEEQEESDSLSEFLNQMAASHSLLIFLTDQEGSILYSADEHNSVYRQPPGRIGPENGKNNPYRKSDEPMNWERGAFRSLPWDYTGFLDRLSSSEDGCIGYITENGRTYIYGRRLPVPETADGQKTVLYISVQLGAVGAAVGILRIQLIWVTLASLVIGFIIAYFFSRQFARPVGAISQQAKDMAAGEFQSDYKKGFCLELDELSDTLGETAVALERLENARRELLANVSHDLRTPLTMIKGYAEMIRDISGDDKERREEDLDIIIRETDRLTLLVNDILEYSAMGREEAVQEYSEMDLSRAAQYVVEQFAPLCSQRGCRIEAAIEPELWVNGDESQMKRVFYNLIDNAVSHSKSSQKVEVSVKNTGNLIRAEIRDYGDGIPKEELPYIWDRYFTAKQRRNNGSRSGLGLAITKEILIRQKADFGVESEMGQGCVFWFEMKKSGEKEE